MQLLRLVWVAFASLRCCFAVALLLLRLACRRKLEHNCREIQPSNDSFSHFNALFSGVGYNEAKDMLPPDVFVACRNSKSSCTISGPTESVEKVIESFKEKKIFVRGVNVSNIAYHSPYIKPAAPFLHEALLRVRNFLSFYIALVFR